MKEYPDNESVLAIVDEFLSQNSAWDSRKEEYKATARRLAEFLNVDNVPLIYGTWAEVNGFSGDKGQVDAILKLGRKVREGVRPRRRSK